MHIRDAFLADILTHPADDTPRLILADWLEENDQPERAEFIRVQCRLALLERYSIGNEILELPGLRKRERDLLNAHRAEWFVLLGRRPGFGENEPLRWWPVASNEDERVGRSKLMDGGKIPVMTAAMEGRPTRGFVSWLSLSSADWLAHADELTAAQPIERVTLTTPLDRYYPNWKRGIPHKDMKPLHVLKHEWPRITFALPPTRGVVAGLLNAAEEEIAGALPGVPVYRR